MSYDNPQPMPSSSTRARVARADEKDNGQEAEMEGLNSMKTSGTQPGATVVSQQQGSGSGGGSSPSGGSGTGSSTGGRRRPNSDDMDGVSSGNDSGERESEAHGRESTRSSHSSSNGKDSGMMLETTESNKR